jgi:hypothetical protein
LKKPPKASRRWWLWPFGLAILAVILLSTLRWVVQPERLGRFLLERAEAASGLDLEVEGPPRLGIWPRLHLRLNGLAVRDPALPGDPLARAGHVALYLPLSALRGDQRIDSITVSGLELDLRRLAQRSSDQMGPPQAPWLPQIANLEIEDGQLIDTVWRLDAIELSLEHLLDPARPVQIALSAQLQANDRPAIPFRLDLSAENPASGEPLIWRLQRFQFGDEARWLMDAAKGSLSLPDWTSPQLALEGDWLDWPASWPELPEPVAELLRQTRFELRVNPRDPEAMLRLNTQGEGRQAQVALHPQQLADWLEAGDWLAPLPGNAQIRIDQLERDGLRIEGLELQHGPDGTN